MAQFTYGGVTVTISDDIEVPEKAGTLTVEDIRRLPHPKRGLGLVCETTADAMEKAPDKFSIPNLTAARLRKQGQMADGIDKVIVDLEYLTFRMKQANLLLDSQAYESLRRVLTFVRGQEKFDPGLAARVPSLIAFFARSPTKVVEPEPTEPEPDPAELA
jgi:hypothetical protein